MRQCEVRILGKRGVEQRLGADIRRQQQVEAADVAFGSARRPGSSTAAQTDLLIASSL
jgi:hypothetical protein